MIMFAVLILELTISAYLSLVDMGYVLGDCCSFTCDLSVILHVLITLLMMDMLV